jgi:hypothetical protein
MLFLETLHNSLIHRAKHPNLSSPITHFRQKYRMAVRIMGIALAEYKPDRMQTN